ncbi:MAG: hypothetical protein CSA29_01140 [Desulfobacterales bacterium]|nr:MAG: hypothetical protein CSA29_01140 [Desulfobacterales bacterium]
MTKDNDLLAGPSMFDLRGKQSVRATFKLSQKAIDSLGLLSVHMGIKQKSLFDHIIEDYAALDQLAQTIRIRQFKKIPRRQKTFVLSRKTIEALTAISDNYNMPRDALVEYSIKKLESVIQSEKIKHEQRKELSARMAEAFQHPLALYKEAADTLGADDPFCRRMEKVVAAMEKTHRDVNAFLEKSKVLEDF